MTTVLERRGDRRQAEQKRRSFWSVVGGVFESEPGYEVGGFVRILMVGAAALYFGYGAGTENAVTKFRVDLIDSVTRAWEASVTNRCLIFWQVAAMPGGEPVPDWCVERLRRARLEPKFETPAAIVPIEP